MSRWAKHEGALAHISLKRWIEVELQFAQHFPARPADSESSVLQSFFLPQPEHSQPNVTTEKAKQMHLNWSPLGFMLDLSTNKFETCFPLDVWQAFLCRSFGSAHPQDACPCSQSHALLLQDVY